MYIPYLINPLVRNLSKNPVCIIHHLFLYLICIHWTPAYIALVNKIYYLEPSMFTTEGIDKDSPRIRKPNAERIPEKVVDITWSKLYKEPPFLHAFRLKQCRVNMDSFHILLLFKKKKKSFSSP